MSQPGNILLIEKGELFGGPMRSLMSNHGTEVQVFRDPDASLQTILKSAGRASCILVEGGLGAPEAVDFVRTLRDGGCATPIIVAVEAGESEIAQGFMAAGATQVIGVPLIYAYLMNRLGDYTAQTSTTEPYKLALHDGTEVTLRFLHPDDADIEQAFIRGLSDRSRYLRFFTYFKELPAASLQTFTHNVFPGSYAVIATLKTAEEETQIGVARYAPTEDAHTAEFAVVVADQWQGLGLGSSLLHIIIAAAAIAGYRQIVGVILRENKAMLRLSKKLGFTPVSDFREDPTALQVRKMLVGSSTHKE